MFQYCQAVFSETMAFIVMPVPDRTIWQLSKSGPFQSYVSRTLYLPVPSTKALLSKRVDFIKRKMGEESGIGGGYFPSKGIRLDIANLEAFAACVEETFLRTEFVSRRIAWLCNHDLRRSLQLSQRIITAPILKVDEIVMAYFSTRQVFLPNNRIMQALLFGDYNHFNAASHECITNVFAAEEEDVSTPILCLRRLRHLADREAKAGSAKGAYATVDEVVNYFDPMGISAYALRLTVDRMFKFRLIEAYDAAAEELDLAMPFAVTFSGKMHMEMALGDAVYVSEMAFTTKIREFRRLSRCETSAGAV